MHDGQRPREEAQGSPSNAVYARVGDAVLQTAREGVHRQLTPQEITRSIVEKHKIQLNVGELRLLLASRRVASPGSSKGRTKHSLRAIRAIETVDGEPYRIVLRLEPRDQSLDDEQARNVKVRWAERAGYTILARNVGEQHRPYNAIIRINEAGADNQNRDYLAEIVDTDEPSD